MLTYEQTVALRREVFESVASRRPNNVTHQHIKETEIIVNYLLTGKATARQQRSND